LAGIVLQLAVLALLTGGFRLNYVLATALAVESPQSSTITYGTGAYTWGRRSRTKSALRLLTFKPHHRRAFHRR